MTNTSYINYFKETSIGGYISIDNTVKPIKNIISSFTNIKITSTKFYKHISKVSNEGQALTGFNLIVNYSVTENFKYSTFDSNDLLFFSFSKYNNSCYIMLPEYIGSVHIEDIINRNLYSLSFNLENIELDVINEKSIFYHFTIIFTVNILNLSTHFGS